MLELRLQLAEARTSLRTAKDALETAKIVATMEVSGKNPEERKSNAALALLNDRAYTEALIYVREWEAEVERAEAEIAEQEYQLRVREVAAREDLAKALMGRRADDAVIDQAMSVVRRLADISARHGAVSDYYLAEIDGVIGAANDLLGRRSNDATIDTLSSVEAAQRRGYAPVDTTEWFGR